MSTTSRGFEVVRCPLALSAPVHAARSQAFCLSGAVARLPISMMSLGIVLALNHLYDNSDHRRHH